MYKKIILFVLGCFLSFIINGCVVRTYSVTRERIDQELTEGNRGYLMGAPEVSMERPEKATRQMQVVEVEFHPIKMKAQQPPVSEPATILPVSARESSKKKKTIPPVMKPIVASPVESSPVESSKAMVMKKYTVRKGDTLQSISNKFYGTTKRWKEIYDVNQEILKSQDKIYPGQTIEIPIEEITGTK